MESLANEYYKPILKWAGGKNVELLDEVLVEIQNALNSGSEKS